MTVPGAPTLKTQFDMLAHYNAFANRRLYDAAAALSDCRLSRRPWRLLQIGAWHAQSSARRRPHLDEALHRRKATRPIGLTPSCSSEFAPLRAAREAEDSRICVYVEALGEADLARTISYRRVTSNQLRSNSRCGRPWRISSTTRRIIAARFMRC